MILVTGAAGKTGRAVIAALAAQGEPVRALVRRPSEGLAAQEQVAGDMRAPETLTQAMRGVQSVYFICPNMSPDEQLLGQLTIRIAKAAGVDHFVYHSVLHPQVEAMPHHWHKMRVEEQLFESGLGYTILQPAAYMQNMLAYWPQIVSEGVYRLPYRAEARLSLVDLEDVGAAAAVVLTQPGHLGAIYELVGTEPLAQTEVAKLFGQALGRPVAVEMTSLAEWEQQARTAGLGDYQVDTLLKMFRYYDQYGFEGNPNVLRWLLGRNPTTLAEFIRRTVQERSS